MKIIAIKLFYWASQVAQTVESACNAGDSDWIPGSGRSPGGEHSNPLQYSCLENPMERGAWQAAVYGVSKESDMTEQLTLPLSYCCLA